MRDAAARIRSFATARDKKIGTATESHYWRLKRAGMHEKRKERFFQTAKIGHLVHCGLRFQGRLIIRDTIKFFIIHGSLTLFGIGIRGRRRCCGLIHLLQLTAAYILRV